MYMPDLLFKTGFQGLIKIYLIKRLSHIFMLVVKSWWNLQNKPQEILVFTGYDSSHIILVLRQEDYHKFNASL